jgi:LppP/LprE lipoprotein
MVKRSVSALVAVALGASGGALLGGCGSATKTVSVGGPPPISQTTGTNAQTTASTPIATTPQSTAPGQTTTNGGVQAPASTHTAPEPAFAQQEGVAEGLGAATAVVRAQGFTPNDTSDYHSNQALRVLIGTRTGSGDGYGQQAFFFVNGRYIGTDSKQPSATLRVVAQGDTEVTLEYPLYHKGDPLSSPSGGQARVRFQLNNGKLVPLDTIPPVSARQ